MSTVVGMLRGASAHPADNPDAVYSGRLPEHKNIRAVFHDYSGGDYFVTICTYGKNISLEKYEIMTWYLAK